MTKNGLRRGLSPLICLGCLVAVVAAGRGEDKPAAAAPAPKPYILTLQAAMEFALENNPGIAAVRQQRGIASARVVIAETYPFNPVLENRIQAASGPASAAVTNPVPLEHILILELELRHQGRYRRQGAAASLSRTEWEIAFQEQALAVQVIRAYLGLLYRQEKLKLLNETLQVNERLVEDVRRLITGGKLRSGDLIVARSEVSDTLDLVAAGRQDLIAARQELFRALGILDSTWEIEGPFDTPPWNWDPAALSELALARRADLHARQMAVAEADANVRLTVANRFGNPTIGAAYTYDPTQINMIGAQINVPIPALNTRRGEIFQSRAEHEQAVLLLRQAEFNVRQEVQSALARLAAAEQRALQSRSKLQPDLKENVKDMQTLFLAGDPSADALKIIDVRRKWLKARDSYLDTIWSVRQARADVLTATGEPVLGLCGQPAPAGPPR